MRTVQSINIHPKQTLFKVFTNVLMMGCLFTATAKADVPVSVENLLTDSHKFKFEVGLTYATSDRRNVNASFDTVQTGTGDFILLPVRVGEERRNTDVVVTTLGLRYGVTQDSEVYTRLTATSRHSRSVLGSQFRSESNQQVNEWIVGLNHKVSEDNATPALLGFVEISLAENTRIDSSDFVSGKTLQIGLTTYRTIDPLVISLTTGYRYSGERKMQENTVDPGDLFFVNPNVAFAVNDKVTLTGGVQLRFRGEDRKEDKKVGIRTTSTDLSLGLAYSSSPKSALNFTARADTSGDTGSQVGFNWLYTF